MPPDPSRRRRATQKPVGSTGRLPSGALDSDVGSALGSRLGGSRDGVPKWLGKRVGAFRLLSLLGQGSWGRVFEAEDIDLRRRVALKVIRGRDRDGKPRDAAAAVVREARAAAKLTHPHVVQVFATGKDEGLLYIAMELCEGGTLRELVKTTGPLEVVRACSLLADACDGLHAAHEAGVLHRDLKPGNLMLTRQGRCKVADFGLATIDDPSDGHQYERTAGTPHFVAPEVVRDLPATARSDVYSMGATLYYLLAGQTPFAAHDDGTSGSRRRVLKAHLRSPVPALAESRSDVPAGLADLVKRCMAKDPADRPENARELAVALRRFTIPDPHPPTPHTSRAAHASADRPAGGRAGRGSAVAVRRPRPVWLPVTLVTLVTLAAVFGTGYAVYVALNPTPPPNYAVTEPGPAPESAAEPAPEPVPTPTPTPTTTPPPAREPVRQPEPAVATTDLADADALRSAAESGGVLVIEGRVSYARVSRSGKVFRLGFEGVDLGEFQVAWFPPTFDAMADAFGGEAGDGLFGKTIRLEGEASLSPFDGSQVIVESPGQITVLD